MTLSFWTKTSGTWINVLTVLAGTALGLMLNRLPQSWLRIVAQGVGLLTLWLGLTMSGSLTQVQAGVDGAVLGLLAIALGGIIGEWWQLEERLAAVGDWLKQRFRGQGRFTEGFVAASLLFCVGPMTLIGSLNNGLSGDNTLLTLKAAMDGIAALVFTSTYGIGVGFSTLVILVYQGGLSLAAGTLATAIGDPATDPRVVLATGVGGLMIMGIGLNLLEVTKIRVASFLPALLLAPVIYGVAQWLT
ncbi:MAG: DUF554 domain-containing protein [Cyanophyceae cyanobacterium]